MRQRHVLIINQPQAQAIREAHQIIARLREAIELEAAGVLEGLHEIIGQLDRDTTHSRHVESRHIHWAEGEVAKVTGSIPPSLRLVDDCDHDLGRLLDRITDRIKDERRGL